MFHCIPVLGLHAMATSGSQACAAWDSLVAFKNVAAPFGLVSADAFAVWAHYGSFAFARPARFAALCSIQRLGSRFVSSHLRI